MKMKEVMELWDSNLMVPLAGVGSFHIGMAPFILRQINVSVPRMNRRKKGETK